MSDSESDYSSDSDESTASESDQPIVRSQALFRSLRAAHSPVDNAADPHTQLTYLRSPRYHLSLPPELLAHVLSNFSRHDASQLPPRDWARNNDTLFSASLVSKAWGTAAHPFLYTADMHISWRTSSSTKLVRTFREHPSLCLRVRTLVVHYTTYEDWSEEWKNTSEGRRAERVARRKWPRVIDSDGDSESDDEGQLDSFVWTAMEASRVFKGDDSWLSVEVGAEGRSEGARLFWRWIAQLPNLQILSTRVFDKRVLHEVPEDLKAVLSGLVRFEVTAEALDLYAVVPSMVNTNILVINGCTVDALPEADPSPPAGHGRLQYLLVRYRFQQERTFALLGLDLSGLVAIDLKRPDDGTILALTTLLPSLRSLRSLAISIHARYEPQPPGPPPNSSTPLPLLASSTSPSPSTTTNTPSSSPTSPARSNPSRSTSKTTRRRARPWSPPPSPTRSSGRGCTRPPSVQCTPSSAGERVCRPTRRGSRYSGRGLRSGCGRRRGTGGSMGAST